MIYSAQLGDIALGSFTLGESGSGIPFIQDNLNNWTDAVVVAGDITGGIGVADSLNNWLDSVPSSGEVSSTLGDIELGSFTLGEVRDSSVGLGESPTVTRSVADDLDDWSDAFRLGLGLQLIGESANNWSDALSTFYGVNVVALSRSVEDSLARTGPGNSPNKDAWKDGLQLNLAPFGDLYIAIDDLETYLQDELKTGLGLHVADDLNNWNDFATNSRNSGIAAFDSMFFFQGSDVAIGLGLLIAVSDTSNFWADAFNSNQTGDRAVQDSLNFWQDSVLVAATTLPAANDQIVLSDAIQVALGIALGVTDDLNNWNELFQNSPASVSVGVAVADTMTMTDALATLAGSSNVGYLRRYLNDVIR